MNYNGLIGNNSGLIGNHRNQISKAAFSLFQKSSNNSYFLVNIVSLCSIQVRNRTNRFKYYFLKIVYYCFYIFLLHIRVVINIVIYQVINSLKLMQNKELKNCPISISFCLMKSKYAKIIKENYNCLQR